MFFFLIILHFLRRGKVSYGSVPYAAPYREKNTVRSTDRKECDHIGIVFVGLLVWFHQSVTFHSEKVTFHSDGIPEKWLIPTVSGNCVFLIDLIIDY